MRQEQERAVQAQIDAGERPPEAIEELPLPSLPYVSLSPNTHRSAVLMPSFSIGVVRL